MDRSRWISTGGRSLAALLVLALAGCTSWPQEGSGGLAEFQQIENARAADLDAHLDFLETRGAMTFAASDTLEARTTLIRVRRELIGGLERDAEIDMDRVDARISVIEKRLGARAPIRRGVR